jgi:uridine kinase
MNWSSQLARLVAAIESKRRSIPLHRALLAGISGIDGSGKSTLAPIVTQRLNALGRRTALIQLDDWHNPPAVRYNPQRPAETFYEKGLRLDELFSRLVVPLKQHRRVRLQATISRQPDERPFQHTFAYEGVDVILFEGIFIFKQQFRAHFDFRCWVECPFDVALQRALRRNQEGLPAEAIVRDYHTIYFPAQRLHIAQDRPAEDVDFLFQNGADALPARPVERLTEVAIL